MHSGHTHAAEVERWIGDLTEQYDVIAPRPDRGRWIFAPLDAHSDVLSSACRPTDQPPGRVFAPYDDVLLRFGPDASGAQAVQVVLDETPRVLAGVRPCDLRGIALLDAVQAAGNADPHYQTRRAHTVIIARVCTEACSERCFCTAMGSAGHTEGADVLLTPDGDRVHVRALTPKGQALAAGLQLTPGDPPELAPFGRALPAPLEQISAAVAASWSSPLWQKHAAACLACGTCNVVCPTCYCFDVTDQVRTDDPCSGCRIRSPDGCMLPDFASVAGGHDFRPDQAARQRHRVKRKVEYLPLAHGLPFCTGCGRCGTQCTANIDIFDILSDFAGVPA